MSESSLEQEERLARQRLYNALELGLTKLQHDPASITTEDAQALADVVPEGDEQIVTLAVALQEMAIQNASNKEVILSDEGYAPTNRLSQLAEDLYAAVIANPEDVTAKTLQTTKSILDMMQQAMHRANAPHPELQAELQQEYARIVPKVERSEAENSDPPASKGQINGHGQATDTRLRRQVSARSDSSNISPRATRHHEGLRRVSDPESLERLIDGMAESQAALALLSLREQHSPERDGNTSPNLSEKPRRSLSDATDFPLGNGGHHTESSRADNHAPTNIDNGGLGKVSGLRRRKDSHSVS